MKATCVFGRAYLPEATVIEMHYDSDTPGYYAVPADETGAYLAAYAADSRASAAIIPNPLALALQTSGAWIGIKIISVNGIAAWGRCTLD